MLSPFLVSPPKIPYPISLPLLNNPPTPSLSWHPPTLGHPAFSGPRASPPMDAQQGYPLLRMQLESWVPPCVLFWRWLSLWELWEYCMVHIVVPPMGPQVPSAPSVPSPTPPSRPTPTPQLSRMVGCKLPPLYLSGSGRASQGTAISGFCHQILVGNHNSVTSRFWWMYMGWILRWAVSGWYFLRSLIHTCVCLHVYFVPHS